MRQMRSLHRSTEGGTAFLKALAIDPGKTTGLAIRASRSEYLTCIGESDEEVLDFIHSTIPSIVIVERFATSGRISKYGLRTVELVGAVRGICYALDIEVVRQVPGSRKAWQHIAHGMLAGKSRPIHEEDALAHLLCFEEGKGIGFGSIARS